MVLVDSVLWKVGFVTIGSSLMELNYCSFPFMVTQSSWSPPFLGTAASNVLHIDATRFRAGAFLSSARKRVLPFLSERGLATTGRL